ncbi:antibiotic biosynthesis monooxygenase family protein [Kitasatospora sp. NPDC093558]|uniref:putative quinol monooxygenase n=1 Tax=Kitasatospora sp. NPDC093558 TaxID=3155201 RepID=UPI0034355D07
MIVEYIRYRIAESEGEEFEQAYAKAATALDAAEECVDYDLSRCTEDRTAYTLRIRWTSAEAHLQGFRKGPHFPPFFAAVKPYVGAIEEMRHYEPTAVRSR